MFLNMKQIGEELKSLRIKKNLSLEQIGKSLDLHPNTIAKYEKDASDMQLDTLERYLEYFDVDELLFFKMIREYNHNGCVPK